MNSVMPSAETFAVDKEETKLTIPSIDDLSQKNVLAPALAEANLVDPHQKLLEQKSSEDDDTDTFPDLDEKSDVDIELQDSESVTPPGVHLTSNPSTTFTYNDAVINEMTGEELFNLVMLFITLLPDIEDEPSIWSKIIAGLQCALRDCRVAFPRLTTVATPVGNGTFIIRRARSECVCVIA
ncbi:hypothetical protein KIN20_011194 [Parelaphostrongylus tenuis]|uniref:Uncharacterized protein n=1 Tax=Parelaphostrongylus tenuis TaxID=148309 RepID=A0AAD5MRQ9_PARTN|nr:hypothetical protein KIN20_011194 [Parelaphostrongylus tenuis]